MREIKFRAWDKTTKTMCYLTNPHWSLYFGSKGAEVLNLQNGSGGDEYELMQYIGITDKFKKDVYESDRVKFKLFDKEYIATVKYVDKWATFGFAVKGSAFLVRTDLLENDEFVDIEIIGNIWEEAK